MIEAKNVCKSFDGFTALDGLSLTVPDSAVYGLVGPNGAGKSTFIRNLAGIYAPDSGSITADGVPVFENTDFKSRLAYVPDEIFYYTQATAADMMKLYAGVYPRFSKERFEKLGEIFRMDLNRPMRKLSKGLQKQTAFRLALSCMPDYVVLDEPIDGLDPVMRKNVWSVLIEDIAERGTTVLISSHNLRELEDVCDHVGIMDKGKMMLERSLSELQNNLMKIQLVLPDGIGLPDNLDILGKTAVGKLQQIVVRGDSRKTEAAIEALTPVYYESVPLTLEEIFIYELGGEGYEIRNVSL